MDESKSNTKSEAAFGRFLQIIMRLRGEGGCPWDIEQTPMSMRSPLIEEVFEACDAITQADAPHVCEELGDVFLNALMIAYMHEQSGDFTVADVFTAVSEKLVRRHPHVFGEKEAQELTSAEVLTQWEKIKKTVEKRDYESVLDSVPKGFPPILKAYKLQKKAAKNGFDWDTPEGAYQKVLEEIDEVKTAAQNAQNTPEQSAAQTEEEIGDLLFSVINWARKLKIDPSTALACANEKFARRFRYVEKQCAAKNIVMPETPLAELDALWDEAKDAV
ncbi:MAG: nucleoside triphosphate pyrophosphohydrolase [Treponemataceae bacterium]|nr:MAG: nucleoside triphosphate pyrophosphohydrolase [Treponemataceae bacterium]